jgi:anti-sigma factor (TIGR02949 family)
MSDRETACAWAQEMIEAYVDGELSADKAARLESHLLSCPTCAEELALAKRVKRTLGDLPQQSCPDKIVDAVLARAAIESPAAKRHRVRAADVGRYTWVWRAAAIAAVVVLVGIGISVFRRPQPTGPPATLSPEELAFAEHQVKWTLAYVDAITRRSAFMVTDDVFETRVLPPIQRALAGVLEEEGASQERSDL